MLGDIIQIISPTNDTFHEKRYLVEYIDKHYIKIMNDSQEEILTLNASSNLNDTSITKILLLKRNEHKGYAKQNNLNQGTWINIHFAGDFPTIVTGYIQSLEEDMIEVKLADDILGSEAGDTYTEMLDQERAKQLSQQMNLGIAEALVAQFGGLVNDKSGG